MTQTLGRQPCRRSFENATHLDAVPDIFEGEPSDDEPARGVGLEQSLVGQALQSEPDRGPRHSETTC